MRVCSLCHRCYDDSVVSCTEAGHPPLPETRRGSPEMVPGYRLDYLLESVVNGGTYRGSQIASGQSCRITVLSTDETSSRQFLDEANLAAALFHPNIADVYETGSLEDGEVFVVAEDPEGEALRELLDNVGVPHLLTSIQVVRQTAEALHVLHLKGLTHRAVGPANIILTTDAEHRLLVRIKDIDFGGVIERSIVSNKFFIDSAIDSLKYFAPEQCSGEAVSMKTDVYGLGVVLYEMLAGVPPFEAEKAAALIHKHKNQRPPEIRIDNFELRMLLSHTLMESLTKRPDKRQSSANAFARQMRHIEQLATHVSTPPPAGVVPPAPPRTTAVGTASAVTSLRPAVLQPAAAIETRKVIYREYTQPFTAVIENEPASVLKAESDLTVTAFNDESEAIAVIDPGNPAPDNVIAIPGLLSAEPAVQNLVPVVEALVKEKIATTAARLSRLRMRRKKLHPKTAAPSTEIPANETLPVVEPAEVKPVQIQAVPLEISARQSEPERAVAIPLRREPAKIEWDQPEDDIPSEADVLEVLSKEQVAEVPVVHAEPEKIAVVPVLRAEPEKAVPAPVDGAKPEKIAVFPVHRKPDRIKIHPPVAAIPPKANAPAVLSKNQVTEVPIIDVEPEEITVVSPPGRRIRIDWDQPRPAQNRSNYRRSSANKRNEGSFFPTILGAAGNEGAIDLNQRDSMFSAHYPSTGTRFSVPRRALMVGGGVTALIVVFLFGDDIVKSYSPTDDPGRSTAATTISKEGSLARPIQNDAVMAPKQKAVKTFRKSVPESDVALKAGGQPPLSKTPTVSRSAEKIPENGKTKLKTEPEKKSADKKPLSNPNKTAGTSRPRIVKVSNP